MALLSQRCFFIDFPFYHKTFSPGMDLDWQSNVRRLKAHGHDIEDIPPKHLKVGYLRAIDWALADAEDEQSVAMQRAHMPPGQ